MSVTATETTAHSLLDPRFWIRSPLFDTSFIMGGALFTLLVAATAFQIPQWVPIFFWIWVIGFEGSHFWATFNRTYFDTDFRKKNSLVLYGSLVFFAFPAIALILEKLYPSISFSTLYGFFIFTWSLYHNARQHYGFLSIYSKKTGIPMEYKSQLTKVLYGSICVAQLYFLINFKAPFSFGLSQPQKMSATFAFATNQLLMLLSLGALVCLFYFSWKAYKKFGKGTLIPSFFIGVCWFFYNIMFFYIAPKDHFVQNLNGGETLMLIAIMNSLFHNIQYHAIVYHYGQKRYQTPNPFFGMARFINRGLGSYAFFGILLGIVFGFIVWNVGDWPDPQGAWTNPMMRSWAFVLFFGIIGHHFYLDQKIWRPSQSEELREYLGTNKS